MTIKAQFSSIALIKFFLVALVLSLLLNKSSFAENRFIAPISSGDEMNITQYPAKGQYLFLWLAPSYGFRGAHRSLAEKISEEKIEVWQTDIIESLFLPLGSSSIKKLDGHRVADLIEYAHAKTGKKVVVVSDSYGSLSALNGAHQWQQRQHSNPYFIGAILFSPYAYESIPPLGQLPRYMPIVSATNIPLMIYQANNSANINQFESLTDNLQQHGNPLYIRMMPKGTIRFYDENPNEKTLKRFKPLAKNIKKMVSVLERHTVPTKTITVRKRKTTKSGIDIYLKKYHGNITPLAINLEDAHGKPFIKNNYKNKITIINFWATWCPPCVQEIPSLNRLKKKS